MIQELAWKKPDSLHARRRLLTGRDGVRRQQVVDLE